MMRVLICLLALASVCSALPAYEVTINYNYGEFTLLGFEEIDVAYMPDRELDEAAYETQKKYGADDDYYTFTLLSDAGAVYTIHDRYPVVLHYDYMDTSESRGGLIELNNVNNSYILPYSSEVTGFSVSDKDGNEVYGVDLTTFVGGGQKEPSVAPPEEPTQQPPQKPAEAFPFIPVLVAFVIVLMVFFIWQSRRE